MSHCSCRNIEDGNAGQARQERPDLSWATAVRKDRQRFHRTAVVQAQP
jgi:hypothetical protein